MNGWSFAIVNGKLAEIYFEKIKGKLVFNGHCYVKRSEYKTKKEQKYIDQDTKTYNFVFRKGKYKDINTDRIINLQPLDIKD